MKTNEKPGCIVDAAEALKRISVELNSIARLVSEDRTISSLSRVAVTSSLVHLGNHMNIYADYLQDELAEFASFGASAERF